MHCQWEKNMRCLHLMILAIAGTRKTKKIIYSGSENLFAAGAGFENQLYFYCYGLKISDHIRNSYLGLQQLQFEVEDGNECAADSHNCDLNAHCFITMGSLQCFCKAGYTGDGTTGNCADCHKICDLNAYSSNSVGSFACSCRAGYTGNGTTGNCAENYITLTNDVGTAFANNEYSGAYNATKAFKMQDIGDNAYWRTKRNPP